jgi:hypothetical protein
MKHCERGHQKPVPENLDHYLTTTQQQGITQAEKYGWHLEFVRRPPFEEPWAVISNQDDNRMGIIREDGTVDTSVQIVLRNHS